MIDALLKGSDLQEALSRVYAHAVATRAGYVTAEYEQDRDGVDLRIQAGGAFATGTRSATEGDRQSGCVR